MNPLSCFKAARIVLAPALLAALLLPTSHAAEATNKIGITMVDIPAGSFLMGSCKVTDSMKEENKKRAFLGQAPLSSNCNNPDSDARDNETPQHKVSVRAFQMGKTEVTLGQFKKFIAAAGRSNLLTDDFKQYNAHGDNAPVAKVSWHDAQDFIKWLNGVEGGYRLPSEAEWEYACRAGGTHLYCGSNDVNAIGWYDDNSGGRPHAVATKQANAFGLYDMSGNVWEWVQDCYHDTYRGAPTDGSARESGQCNLRGLRGGSWYNDAMSTRAAYHLKLSSDDRSNGIGFRLARTR